MRIGWGEGGEEMRTISFFNNVILETKFCKECFGHIFQFTIFCFQYVKFS